MYPSFCLGMPAVSRHLCRVLGRGVVRCKPKIFQQQAQVVDLLVSRSQKKQASSTAAAPFPFPHPLSSAHPGSRSYVLGLGPTNCYAPVHNPLHGALVAVSPSVQSQTGGLSGGWPAAGLHTAASPLLRPRSSSADAAAAAVDTAAARSGSAARSAEEVAEYVSRTRTRSRRSDQVQPTDAAGAHGLSPRRAKARYCTSQEVKVIVERYIDNAVAIGSTDLKPIYLPMPEEVPGITKREMRRWKWEMQTDARKQALVQIRRGRGRGKGRGEMKGAKNSDLNNDGACARPHGRAQCDGRERSYDRSGRGRPSDSRGRGGGDSTPEGGWPIDAAIRPFKFQREDGWPISSAVQSAEKALYLSDGALVAKPDAISNTLLQLGTANAEMHKDIIQGGKRPRNMANLRENLQKVVLRLYPIAVTQLPKMDENALKNLATAVGLLSSTFAGPPLLLAGIEQRMTELLLVETASSPSPSSPSLASSSVSSASSAPSPLTKASRSTPLPPTAALVMVLDAFERHKPSYGMSQHLWDAALAHTSADVATLDATLRGSELATLLKLLARNGKLPPPTAIHNLMECCATKLHTMDARNLTDLVWGCSKLMIVLPDTHPEHLSAVSEKMSPSLWVQLMSSYARIGHIPSDTVLESMSQSIIDAHNRKWILPGRAVSELYWAHASLDLRPSAALAQVLVGSKQAVHRVHSMSAMGLANFVWAHAHLMIPIPPPLLSAVEARVLALLKGGEFGESRTRAKGNEGAGSDGGGSGGRVDGPANKVNSRLWDSAKNASQILWSFAVLDYLQYSPAAVEVLQHLLAMPKGSWHQQTFLQIHQVLMSINILSMKPDGSMQLEKLSRLDPVVADMVKVCRLTIEEGDEVFSEVFQKYSRANCKREPGMFQNDVFSVVKTMDSTVKMDTLMPKKYSYYSADMTISLDVDSSSSSGKREVAGAGVDANRVDLVVEADGPNHFSSQAGTQGKVQAVGPSNLRGRGWSRLADDALKDDAGSFQYRVTGSTALKKRLVQGAGGVVISVPFYDWDLLKTVEDKQRYIYGLLEDEGCDHAILEAMLPFQVHNKKTPRRKQKASRASRHRKGGRMHK